MIITTPWPLYLRERDPVAILQEAGGAPRLVYAGAKYLSPTGIRNPKFPARCELLYGLRYTDRRRLG
jgi:hypothetical protein